MKKITTWSRPRSYSIYQQNKRRYSRFALAIVPLLIAGAWFVVPTRPVDPNLSSRDQTVQSVAVSKNEQVTQSALPETPAATAEPLADATYTELTSMVNAWVAKQPKSQQWSVVIQDANNDANSVEINQHNSYYMASLYKLFLTMPLSTKYPFTSWSNTQIHTDAGDQTVRDCVEAMISRSDNPCGEAIGREVNWATAAKLANSQGMTDTKMSSSDLRSSAYDVARYLTGLNGGRWFDAPTRDSLLGSLGRQKLRAGIPAGCKECTVLNKTGDLNGVKHDAGIVMHGKNKFVLVIMSQGGSNPQIADLTKLITSKL